MRFRDLKLATKQILGFGTVLVVMAAANVYSIDRMAAIRAEIEEISSNWLPRAVAISDIHQATIDLRLKQLQHVSTSEESQKQEHSDEMIALIDQINANVDVYEALKTESAQRNLYSDDERALYDQFNEKLEAYQDVSLAVFLHSRQNKRQAALDVLNGEGQAVYREISEVLEELVRVNKRDAVAAADRAETTYRRTRTISIVLLIATVLLSALLAALIARYIAGPVRQLVGAVRDVADGQLDRRLNVDSRDEIGRLGTSFDLMTAALREARERTQQEAALRAEAAELKIKAAEAEAKALFAENKRQTHELEQARKLQLSMLPQNLPGLDHLDVGVYMKTATEVGGDYYDFRVSDDGSLTAAVGDATGHGLHAGTMVAATKSLFNALADLHEPADFLRRTSRALLELGFDQMYMAMIVARLDKHRLSLASAGMPPALVFRAFSHKVERVILKGLPLGSHFAFPYKTASLDLESEDTVMLMSDGFPERFNGQGEMLGYETAATLFEEIGYLSPAQIIDRFVQAEEKWADGRPRDDDITFVVLKMK